MDSIIFHIDVNSAFLSWESVYRLSELNETIDLRLIPSAVGGDQSNRHGIILAKSTPAKQFSIQTGEPITEALRKCPTLTVVPSNFPVYERYSKAFHKILREYSPVVEKYSIDEAFLDMSGYNLNATTPIELATSIKDRIYNELGFTVNVGISTNKLLAKMASDFKKPNLVHTLFPNEIKQKMWPLDVRELFFVGKSSEKKLKSYGITTIGELAHTDPAFLKAHFGKYGTTIYEYANGIDYSQVNAVQRSPKGYSNETTLSHDVTCEEEAKHVLLALCETVGSRLREDHVMAYVIGVSITDSNFSNTRHQVSVDSAINTTNELYQTVCKLFDELWNRRSPIRLLGVHTSKLTTESNQQYSLFDSKDRETYQKLDSAIDEIRKKFGSNAIVRASLMDQK